MCGGCECDGFVAYCELSHCRLLLEKGSKINDEARAKGQIGVMLCGGKFIPCHQKSIYNYCLVSSHCGKSQLFTVAQGRSVFTVLLLFHRSGIPRPSFSGQPHRL